MTLEVNFWIKTINLGTCLIWTGAKSSSGYGNIKRNKKSVLAHRQAYEYMNGTIEKNIKVLHRCDNKLCINPDHLFLGTQKDNVIDCINKKRFRAGIKNKLKTECIYGHAYNIDNTYIRKDTKARSCLTCRRLNAKMSYRRRKK